MALDAEISRNMDLLIHRADRLDRMMADLLKYSRIGKAQSFPPTNLSEAFACALDLVKRSQGFDIISDLPKIDVRIAEEDLITLFEALIDNAVAHHHKSTGKIEVLARRDEQRLMIQITDDGPGIDSNQRDTALKVMTGLNRKCELSGSGMGLPICKKIAERYSGVLSLNTAKTGSGLRVDIELCELPNASHKKCEAF
ncbi:MAG: HAMP domain-containing sensor histidine kinase [Litoreibacter sp.]|nr:HAMP domain-containing sensor histidine kinase [Litoreibacter sp.]